MTVLEGDQFVLAARHLGDFKQVLVHVDTTSTPLASESGPGSPGDNPSAT
jgi:hypothetical protein